MKCNSCGYNEEDYNADEFIGIFANGIDFSTTGKKSCALFGCPRCHSIQFSTDENYIEMRKNKYKKIYKTSDGNSSKIKEPKKNTKINYLYRDGCNYKQYNSEIIPGIFTREQIKTIISCLDGEYFIPSQIGFSEIRFDDITEDDTCWFELNINGFEETEEEPTINLTPDEVVELFISAKGNWKEYNIQENPRW